MPGEVRKLSVRIVVTGVGVISSIGAGLAEFESSLFEGKTGIGPRSLFPETVPAGNAAEIRNFTPQQWLGAKGLRVLDRSARLLCVAAAMALRESKLTQDEGAEGDPGLGLVCGTMFGSVHSIASFDWSGLCDGPNLVNPMEFPNTVLNSPAGQAAIKHKLRGVNSTISAGPVSGLFAIHYASEFLRFGRASALLAGGVEELAEESYNSFQRAGLGSASGNMRPFGPDRDGSVVGEGSGLWSLETVESAARRGVSPLLEVGGFGSAHDASVLDGYSVRAEGASTAIRLALETAGIGPDQVGCIIASANGSRTGDAMEARALANVFGPSLSGIPVSAPKAAFGEALGVSGALLAIAGGMALTRRTAPPTAEFQGSDSPLRLSAQPQPFDRDCVLVNCFGCDGNNTALVLRAVGK
jgi:3-oxoacyl-[acyl-carrier-protein] synthase II